MTLSLVLVVLAALVLLGLFFVVYHHTDMLGTLQEDLENLKIELNKLKAKV